AASEEAAVASSPVRARLTARSSFFKGDPPSWWMTPPAGRAVAGAGGTPLDLAVRAELTGDPGLTPGQGVLPARAAPSRPLRRSIPRNGASGVACLGDKSHE